MAGQMTKSGRFSLALWGGAALFLLVPLIAMRFTREVSWTFTDFAVFGAMLAAACGTFELGMRASASGAYRAGVGIAVLAGFLLVWVNLAVGIIGSEGNPANLMYVGVLAIAILGAILACARPRAMARVMIATAFAQALISAIAWIAKLGATDADWPRGIVLGAAIFVPLWLGSAWLFAKAAREPARA